MAIYLTQEGGDETQADEIEGKLKSAIPELKRVPSVEDSAMGVLRFRNWQHCAVGR